jgi:hypothetical protein
MTILRYLLVSLGLLGAVLTFPNSLLNPFTPVCIGCLAVAWFSRNLGKPKEVSGSLQSTQPAPLE